MALPDLSDAELDELGAALVDELRRRALERFDPKALADDAFATGFDAKHLPCDPWITGGLLICCGSLRAKFDGGHRCSFVVVDEDWSWVASHEHDEMRWIDDRSMMCVSIIVAKPDMHVSLIESRCDAGQHKRTSATSWKIVNGDLEPCPTPSRVPTEHRR